MRLTHKQTEALAKYYDEELLAIFILIETGSKMKALRRYKELRKMNRDVHTNVAFREMMDAYLSYTQGDV